MLAYFLQPGIGGWSKEIYIFNRHPDLEKMLAGVNDSKTVYAICYRYVKKFRSEYKNQFKKALSQNEKLWRLAEKKYLTTLEEHFGIAYPPKRKVMKAYVSIIPVYPRWLDIMVIFCGDFFQENSKRISKHFQKVCIEGKQVITHLAIRY